MRALLILVVLPLVFVSHDSEALTVTVTNKYDLITSGGDLYDGSGATAVKADMAISRDKIAAVGNLEWMGHRGRR